MARYRTRSKRGTSRRKKSKPLTKKQFMSLPKAARSRLSRALK